MKKTSTFEERLYVKLREQIKGKKVGFLLGAGASFLSGNGYPLANGLWEAIRTHMPEEEQRLIDNEIMRDSTTLEQALDRLDGGRNEYSSLRHYVTNAVAASFINHTPPLDYHREFVIRLGTRSEKRIPVFTLNYDSLIEIATDIEKRPLIDGFLGTVECYFQPSCFTDYRGILESRRGRSVPVHTSGIINLYKLHGSLGWFKDTESRLKRIRPDMPCPPGCIHLMVPPQNRKAAETGITPYATIWSEFRAHLANDSSRMLNRLVCVGYGLGDGHVNAVIESALARNHFTLVVLAKDLCDDTFKRWQKSPKTIIVTEERSSLYGEEGAGMHDAWAFEWLAKEV